MPVAAHRACGQRADSRLAATDPWCAIKSASPNAGASGQTTPVRMVLEVRSASHRSDLRQVPIDEVLYVIPKDIARRQEIDGVC